MGATGAALVLLGALGVLDSLYFVAVAYRWMRPDARWVPPVCRMDEGTCARIVDTRYGRLIGIPNGVPGVAWYATVVTVGTLEMLSGSIPFRTGFTFLAIAMVAVSVFLAWALIARLKVMCTLCFFAHVLNVAILVILWAPWSPSP